MKFSISLAIWMLVYSHVVNRPKPEPPPVPSENVALSPLVATTNRPPHNPNYVPGPPIAGIAIEFMPLTNSLPIRYTLKYRTNLQAGPWIDYTNVILDGPPHPFYFLVPITTNDPPRWFATFASHL